MSAIRRRVPAAERSQRTPEPQPAEAEAEAPRWSPSVVGPASSILALQRTIGNAGVNRYLGIARQVPPRARRQTAGDRIGQLTSGHGHTALETINPGGDTPNCPAIAQAVQDYIATGEAHAVPAASATTEYNYDTRGTRRVGRDGLARAIRRGGSAVVRGLRDPGWAAAHHLTDEHWFVVANRGGRLVVIDASGDASAQRIVTDVGRFFDEEGLREFEVLGRGNRLTPHDPLEGL